jgi:hypothetical protein
MIIPLGAVQEKRVCIRVFVSVSIDFGCLLRSCIWSFFREVFNRRVTITTGFATTNSAHPAAAK